MALFDKFAQKPGRKSNFVYTPESDYEAWIGILYACISADGDDSDAEIETLSRMIALKQKFTRIDVLPLYEKMEKVAKEIGGMALVEACAKMIEKGDRNTLFTMSVEIVLADGVLADDEEKIIEFIASQLEVEPTLIDKIVEVMLIRNRGNIIEI